MKWMVLFVGMLFLVCTVLANPINSTTYLYMPFNGTVGTTTYYDLSTQGRPVYNYGLQTIQQANASNFRYNNASYLAGAVGYTTTVGNTVNLSNTYPWSISFWMNSSSSSGNTCIVGNRNTTTRNKGEFCIGIVNNNLWVNSNDASEKSTNPAFSMTDKKWHFINTERTSPTLLTVYADGASKGTITLAAGDNIGSNVRNWSIGQNIVDSVYYTGYIDDLVIQNASIGAAVPSVEYVDSGPGAILPINAAFTQSPNPSSAGQTVTFNDTSTGSPVTWNWTLYGTSPTNTTQNAAYTYLASGTYNIFLNVTNATGSWSNTSQTHTVVNASGFTPQDIWMEAQYVQTFHITASDTGLPIPVVQLQDTAMQTYTTTNGTGYLTEPFGASSVVFVSSGYNSKSISYVFDSDATWDVQLTPSTPGGSKNTWYTPKQISISVASYYPAGQKVANATIDLRAIGSSLQDNAQLQTVYGIDPEAANQMVNGSLIMQSTTGMDGASVFTVLASIRYMANVTDPSTGRMWAAPINPGLDPYTIWIGDKPNAVNETEIDSMNDTRLWAFKPDNGNWTMNMQYRDRTGRTSNVRFIVKSAGNLTEVYNVSLGNPGTNVVLANKTYSNIIGDAYYYYWVATRV